MTDPHVQASRLTVLRYRSVPFAVALAVLIAAVPASGQQPQPTEKKDDPALQKEIEAVIQKCIRDKSGSPYICRASAYATALAEGYPAERAARLTGFNRDKP